MLTEGYDSGQLGKCFSEDLTFELNLKEECFSNKEAE